MLDPRVGDIIEPERPHALVGASRLPSRSFHGAVRAADRLRLEHAKD